jgi:hypothetical protein
MRIATDTLTTYLSIEVYNLISDRSVDGYAILRAQGWYDAEIGAYALAGQKAARA